jgi:hypothetical protein
MPAQPDSLNQDHPDARPRVQQKSGVNPTI